MRVLVVEGDPTLRLSITYQLLDHGFEASVSGSARAALDTLQVVLPDVIVIDAGAPHTNVVEFLEEQHAQAVTAGIPVLVTSDGPMEDLSRFASVGVLAKPFSAEELALALRTLVGDRVRRTIPPWSAAATPVPHGEGA